ncbi:hypothetical protein HYT52_03120 [Candidatus Woesearchaeota archaeon]|nr:hypothetical protein [Candidatus Woesearchaeota archaeon]
MQYLNKMNIGNIYNIKLDEKTAYLAGVIIGDGHISNSCKSKTDLSKDYKIAIEVTDYEFLKEIETLTKQVIKTKSTIIGRFDKRLNRQKLYYFQFRNKSFHHFLTNYLGIIAGNKSSLVVVPIKILSSLRLQESFLAGLFDTDGGLRGKTSGFTSASELLIEGVSRILTNLNIVHYRDNWVNKKYNKKYYGIKISKKDNDNFLKKIPIKNKRKQNNCFNHVDVPEWSNGIVYS